MKIIFKKRIGAFNIYSNGRVYADVDKMFKKKPKKQKMTITELEQIKQHKMDNIEQHQQTIKQNIQTIKDAFGKFKRVK